MTDFRHGWKILTHDGRSPLQGGPPLLNGEPFPITLPTRPLDTGPDECAEGWNYVADIPTGWHITKMWPTGYPARIFAVEASSDAIQRGDKRRASSLTLVREATDEELKSALVQFSTPFGSWRDRMAQEQWQWLTALRRPGRNPSEIEAQLALALSARGLPWTLRRFDHAKDVWDATAWAARAARDVWAARAARDVWDDRTAWDAWAARAAWTTRTAWNARAAWAAWDSWDALAARAAWATWDARAAWAAWDALTTFYTRLMGWQQGEPDQYTVGIREAYRQGLSVAAPVGQRILGWAMEESGEEGKA